jgi:hypothetical protein
MAKPKPKGKSKRGVGARQYTLVQAANGTYYLVSKDKPPREVQDQRGLGDFLNDLDDQLSDYLNERQRNMATGSGVHIGTPDIFPK